MTKICIQNNRMVLMKKIKTKMILWQKNQIILIKKLKRNKKKINNKINRNNKM